MNTMTRIIVIENQSPLSPVVNPIPTHAKTVQPLATDDTSEIAIGHVPTSRSASKYSESRCVSVVTKKYAPIASRISR